jgi:hypothetical protein
MLVVLVVVMWRVRGWGRGNISILAILRRFSRHRAVRRLEGTLGCNNEVEYSRHVFILEILDCFVLHIHTPTISRPDSLEHKAGEGTEEKRRRKSICLLATSI